MAGGFGLALACDMVIASESARFGAPELNVGLWPYMVTVSLLRSMPPKKALELMLTSRVVGAEEADRIGFVTRVVPDAELDAAVADLAAVLASKPPGVTKLGRDSFYAVIDSAASEALPYLHAMLTVTSQTAEAREGITAFAGEAAPVVAGGAGRRHGLTRPSTHRPDPRSTHLMAKRALITGVTGQDGSYLAEFLLDKGYEVMRHGPPLEHHQLRADRPHPGPDHPGRRRPARRGLADQHPEGDPAPGGLQPGRPVLRADLVEPAGADRRVHGPRRHPRARRHPDRRPRDPLLPGQLHGDVRQGPGGAAERDHPLLPPQPLRRGQGLRPLDHRQLPRELRPARLLGHPVQPRVAPARPRVRDPQGDPRRGPHRGRHRQDAGPRQPRRPARLGLRRRLRPGHVADAPAGPARRLRGRHRRDPLGARSWSSCRSPPPTSTGRSTWSSTSASCARPRWTC